MHLKNFIPFLLLLILSNGKANATVNGTANFKNENRKETVSVFYSFDTLIITNDTSVCIGQSLPLQALPAFSYAWSPNVGLSDSTISNPTATPTTTTKYKLRTETIGTNLA